MIRKIIQIDESKCNGCGACALACHEGAIGMVNGKARLLRDDYCDGLGDCLPACPAGAITFTEREASPYNENAAAKAKGCLSQWPVQIKLVPVNAPFFNGAHLLIAADCTAFAYARMHQEFMHGRVNLIGCPKLDGIDYSEKLAAILRENNIASITVVRMEVPCCGGLSNAVQKALMNSGRAVEFRVVTISIAGRILPQ